MKKTSIPAIPYMRAVRQWAISTGRPFLTWNDQRKAIAAYNHFESPKN